MPATDVMPSSQVDPLALLRLLGLAAQQATGTPQRPGTPAPAGMTQARTGAAPDATAAATTGTAPQPGPRNASPFGMTRGVAGQTAPPGAANGTPSRPQNAAPAGMTRPQYSEGRTPLGGVVATGAQPTPQNPASPHAAAPDKPDAAAMALNKTEAASEPGNVSQGPVSAPVLSEQDWNKANPAPVHTPFVPAGIGGRLLAGLFAGLTGIRDKEGSNEQLDRFLNQQQQGMEREEDYPEKSAAAQHDAYMRYVEGTEGPLNVQKTQAETRAADALAEQRERDRSTLETQYADAIGRGDKARAANLLGAIKDLTTAQTKETDREPRARTPYDDWRQENPDSPVSDWLDLQNKERAAAPRSSGRATPFSTWRSQNPNSPIEDWFKVSKGSGSEHDVDALEKERDAVSRSYNAKLYDVATDPAQTQQIQQERDARIKTYDRLIHNAQNGYSVGSVIDTPKGKVKITGIRPDGMLEVVPAGAQK